VDREHVHVHRADRTQVALPVVQGPEREFLEFRLRELEFERRFGGLLEALAELAGPAGVHGTDRRRDLVGPVAVQSDVVPEVKAHSLGEHRPQRALVDRLAVPGDLDLDVATRGNDPRFRVERATHQVNGVVGLDGDFLAVGPGDQPEPVWGGHRQCHPVVARRLHSGHRHALDVARDVDGLRAVLDHRRFPGRLGLEQALTARQRGRPGRGDSAQGSPPGQRPAPSFPGADVVV